ncbi:MAG: YdcF family protein [Rudaea sp.]|uniref:YdcF family protein n=1 Tax=Rudaea sp. TaxID=2136325 RepID=UPI0039E50535
MSLLVALLLLCLHKSLPKSARRGLVAIELALVVLMCPLGANALTGWIESRIPTAPVCDEPLPEAIVVLAGGFAREPMRADDYSALDVSSLRRLFGAVELWRQHPDFTLYLAGGGPYAIRESEVLAHLAAQLGVPAQRMRLETTSRTTWENAQFLRAADPPPPRVWLVSSALHLPRAKVAFEAFGFRPCLYASDRAYLPPGGLGYFLPQSSSLDKAEEAIHESIGELVYRWRARASADAGASSSR